MSGAPAPPDASHIHPQGDLRTRMAAEGAVCSGIDHAPGLEVVEASEPRHRQGKATVLPEVFAAASRGPGAARTERAVLVGRVRVLMP